MWSLKGQEGSSVSVCSGGFVEYLVPTSAVFLWSRSVYSHPSSPQNLLPGCSMEVELDSSQTLLGPSSLMHSRSVCWHYFLAFTWKNLIDPVAMASSDYVFTCFLFYFMSFLPPLIETTFEPWFSFWNQTHDMKQFLFLATCPPYWLAKSEFSPKGFCKNFYVKSRFCDFWTSWEQSKWVRVEKEYSINVLRILEIKVTWVIR